MTAKAGCSTPLLPVAEMEKSIPFYEPLGFSTIDTDRCVPVGWACACKVRTGLQLCSGGRSMPWIHRLRL
jgi:hypothetical protein